MSNELTPLLTLAVEIDALNEQANIYANQALVYAAKSGQKLLLAKAQCNHGEFKSWLDENCKIPYATAQRYMRLAKECPQFLNSNLATSPILPSISQMIELLSAPEEIKTEVTAKIEAGEDVTVKEIQRLKKEAADLLASKNALQSDLMQKVEQLDQKQKRINFLELDKEATVKQNDELRNQLAFKVDEQVQARLAEERATLILENQQAIAENKRLAENAQHELERLKREQEKAIADGVTLELNKLDTEIKQKRYQVECYERDLTDLKKVKSELDAEVGALAVHKEAIKNIKEHLSFLTVSFTDAFDTACIPNEVIIEWESIHYALSKLQKQMATFLAENRDAAIAIEGSYTEIETSRDDENEETFA